MHPGRSVLVKFAAQSPKTYPELRDFVEKERPDWLQALMPRRINAPSDYWSQKVLALATIQAAISNQLMKDHRPGRTDLIPVGGIDQLKPALRLMTTETIIPRPLREFTYSFIPLDRHEQVRIVTFRIVHAKTCPRRERISETSFSRSCRVARLC